MAKDECDLQHSRGIPARNSGDLVAGFSQSLRTLIAPVSDILDTLVVITANVSTLHPREIRQSSTKQGCCSTARMLELDGSFFAAGAAIVFVQEGRLQGDGDHSCSNYRMYRAGASKIGSGGSQVWVLHKLVPFVVSVKVVSTHIIHLVFQFGSVFLHALSGHAPVEAANDCDQASFWDTVTAEVEPLTLDPRNLVIVGIDGNARMGSQTNEYVGGVEKATESSNGSLLRAMATECKLVVVNTFFPAGCTWTDAHYNHYRIDYVLVSQNAFKHVDTCAVLDGIDLATKCRDDHNALSAGFRKLLCYYDHSGSSAQDLNLVEKPGPRRPPSYTRESLEDPARICYFQRLISEFEVQPLLTQSRSAACNHLDNNAKNISGYIHLAAKQAFIPERAAPKKTWLSSRTWELVQSCNGMRSALRRWSKSWRQHVLTLAFSCWVAVSERVQFTFARADTAWNFYAGRIAYLDRNVAIVQSRLQRMCRLRRPSILFDKEVSLKQAAQDAQHASATNNTKEVYAIVRRLAGTSLKPLHGIKDENGTHLTSQSDATACWRRHFQKLFKARLVDRLEDCANISSVDAEVPCDDFRSSRAQVVDDNVGNFTFEPTVTEVYEVIQKLPDSGVGEDLLSSRILRAGGWPLAARVHQIILDVVRLEHVPIVWRGGRLVVLYKRKGSPFLPDSYRGLLVSDHLGKILTSLLQRNLDDLRRRRWSMPVRCRETPWNGDGFALPSCFHRHVHCE